MIKARFYLTASVRVRVVAGCAPAALEIRRRNVRKRRVIDARNARYFDARRRQRRRRGRRPPHRRRQRHQRKHA